MEIEMMILVGGVAIAAGAILSAGYYFFRYYITTDHEEDRQHHAQIAEPTPSPYVESGPQTEPAPAELTKAKPEPKLKLVREEPEREISEPPPKAATLSSALSNTRSTFWGRLKGVFSGAGMSADHVDAIEEILYTSDLGPKTVQRLMTSVQNSDQNLQSFDHLKLAFKGEFLNILNPIGKMGSSPLEKIQTQSAPQVWMVVGVNGVGKTTTIGKLAFAAAQQGLKVLVAAGDTFRAAAQNQLKVWSDRARVEIFSPEGVSDPGAVAFDACQLAAGQKFDLVILDTAGRLHTQKNLMEELKKVKRVIQKANPSAPHEILIVLDANSGQNALVQAREFNEALGLTGAVVTKMDGTAKGGVVLGLAEELQLPTRLIGVGEGVQDLRNFSVDEYVSSILE